MAEALRLFLVEDDDNIALVIRRYLERAGHQVTVCHTAADALTFLTDLPKRVSESVTRHRLQQLNRLLIEALESARDGIMITDLQGKLLHVNKALEELTGYTREELLGQTPRLFKSGLHPAAF